MANDTARRLRKTTPQEVKLWVHLRSWRKRGYHFRRQSPRDGYIVDFVCMSRRPVVEVDGGQHGLEANAAKDVERDIWLSRSGFRVLRFWNGDVDRNLDEVLTTIDRTLSESTPPQLAAFADPPPAGEG